MAGITLYQFEGSHYNEKARWALDLKGVPHERARPWISSPERRPGAAIWWATSSASPI
jgi:glutathione S-transferase